jgi:GMP synthase-like glutamine amidotransferase
MATIAVLEHFWCENSGVFMPVLQEAGHRVTEVPLFRGSPLPSPADYDAWIVMGGPMNVDEVDTYPFLASERRLLAKLINADRPVMGMCLGAQLIARSAGARVYAKRPKEIGLFDIHLMPSAADDPLFSLFSNPQEVFQWHGDTFDLPERAVHLARSDRFEHQAFRIGRRVYALQFHLECNLPIARQWLTAWTDEIAALPSEDSVKQFENRWESAFARQNELARKVILQWISL